MSVTITETLYTFEELDESPRKAAIKNHRYDQVEHPDWHTLLTHVASSSACSKTRDGEDPANHGYPGFFEQRAREAGFRIIRIYFSGFGSQGDGASFEATVDYEEYLTRNRLRTRYRTLLDHIQDDGGQLWIKTRGRYSHAGTMYVEEHDIDFFPARDTPRATQHSIKAGEQADELAGTILDHARSLATSFYAELEDLYDDLTSDEAVAEDLKEGDLLFFDDGETYTRPLPDPPPGSASNAAA